ncbi:MAG: hypothetical protein WDW36_004693 [Sanguina aurantia]
MPTALPVVFSAYSTQLPSVLRGRCHGVASSVCFMIPFVRQLWHATGVRHATRESLSALLSARKVVVLIPGGVQEVLAMTHGDEEVAYLTRRRGFARMALRHGAPLAPVFAFGQTATYTWMRPGSPYVPDAWVSAVSRAIGFVPISLHGVWGTALPHKAPLYVVIGKPIPLPLSQRTRAAPARHSSGAAPTEPAAAGGHNTSTIDCKDATAAAAAAAAAAGAGGVAVSGPKQPGVAAGSLLTRRRKAAAASAAGGIPAGQQVGDDPGSGPGHSDGTVAAEACATQRATGPECATAGAVAVGGEGEGEGEAVGAHAEGAGVEESGWEEGDEETVQLYLKQYIAALEALHEKHKVAAGCGHMRLRVI